MIKAMIATIVVIGMYLSALSTAFAAISAGDIKPAKSLQPPKYLFSECCPKPEWWDGITAPKITSLNQLNTMWQDKKQTKLTKAKAFYQAMLDYNGTDDGIVAAAIKLYSYVDKDYPNHMEMLEYGVANFFDYDRPVKNYKGKVGDTSAGLVIKLAYRYNSSKRLQETITVVSKMVKTRGHEINDHQLEHLSLRMIDALMALGRNAEALDVAQYAIANYNGDWEKKLRKKEDELHEIIGISSYLRLEQLNLAALGGGFLIILLIAILWWRARSRRSAQNPAKMRFGR